MRSQQNIKGHKDIKLYNLYEFLLAMLSLESQDVYQTDQQTTQPNSAVRPAFDERFQLKKVRAIAWYSRLYLSSIS